MNSQWIVLICSIFVVSCAAYLREWRRVITVNEENKDEFGLPVGTILKKDKRTKLYIPPSLSDNFSAEARMEIQWANQQTGRYFCKVGPDIEDENLLKKIPDNWCLGTNGNDICCGKTRCLCSIDNVHNCVCIEKNAVGYFEQRKPTDWLDFFKSLNLDRIGPSIGTFPNQIRG